jgi:hypothetical protein
MVRFLIAVFIFLVIVGCGTSTPKRLPAYSPCSGQEARYSPNCHPTGWPPPTPPTTKPTMKITEARVVEVVDDDTMKIPSLALNMDSHSSIERAFFIGFVILFGMLIALQIYLRYRIEEHQQKIWPKPSNTAEPRMSAKASFRFGLFHILFQLYLISWALYSMWAETFSVFLGVGIIVVALALIRKPIQLVRDNRPVHAELSIALPLLPKSTSVITPELIAEILGEESVIDAIKNDLKKTCQIGGKEQWRLSLLAPGMETVNSSYDQLSRQGHLREALEPTTMMNIATQIPVQRIAILHSTSFNIRLNNCMIYHGTYEPMIRRSPGWSYGLRRRISGDDYGNIRDIQINTDSPSARNRNQALPIFLQEDGFPLKDSYTDGDPLTTERGGMIVLDKGEIEIIYSDYFVQSRLIDDEGNLIYMGIDENFQPGSTWHSVAIRPSVSRKLIKCVNYNGYAPIVRYRSFPYASNFMLPILDTPMSDSGWADLFIDTRGKAKLFIAQQKTLKEWYEMMERLRQLFFGELAKKDYNLLGLTKDPMHLYEYFSKKQKILDDYFIVIDWLLV